MVDEHKGRAGQVDEEARHGEGADEHQAQVVPVAQQQAVGAQRAAERTVHAFGLAARFGQRAAHQQHAGHRRQRHHPEHAAPAGQRDHAAARQRRQDGRNAEHQHEQRHQARGLGAGVQVAHDGARNGHAGGSAKALQEAQRHQGVDVGGQRATDAGEREQGQAGVERRLAAHHVGHRAVEQLPQTDGEEERSEGELHRPHLGAQAAPDVGQRGQVHVDGEGADGREQAQHQGHLEITRKHR